jgi:SPP1 family predicted phage head-tail adaptor
MTDPGELRHRLVLEQPVEGADGAGGVTRSYATVTMLWAAVVPVAARGAVGAADVGANVTHRILIRSGPGVTTRHRLREGPRIYRILALRDQDGSGRFVEIAAEEHQAPGAQ